MNIHFNVVRFKNFLAVGDTEFEIPLDKFNTVLIIGRNGGGKSTMIDAICFALFNKPYREINKPQLVNSINKKNCVVEVEFTKGSRHYKVRRGIKPNLFEIYCDGELIEPPSKISDYQDKLEIQILGMDYNIFTQVVILGSAKYVPFMALKTPERRNVVERLLDIRVFSTMNVIVKEMHSELKKEVEDYERELNNLNDSIRRTNQFILDIKSNQEFDSKEYSDEVEVQTAIIDEQLEKKKLLEEKMIDTTDLKEQIATFETELNKAIKMNNKNDASESVIKKQVGFLEENDVCPTCSQEIDPAFTAERLEEFKAELEKMEKESETVSKFIKNRRAKIDKLNNSIAKAMEIVSSIRECDEKISIAESVKETNERIIEKNANRVENELLDKHENDLDTFEKKKKKLVRDNKKNLEKAELYKIALNHLKDKAIKANVIKEYIPKMNEIINMYLQEFGFNINFLFDENFDETIQSRFKEGFTYNSFSQGQKARIDLAILFTWREVAKMKNSVKTNLLIMDEVFERSIDDLATEDLMHIIRTVVKDTNTFIISHTMFDAIDRFDDHILFELNNGFSVMKREKI